MSNFHEFREMCREALEEEFPLTYVDERAGRVYAPEQANEVLDYAARNQKNGSLRGAYAVSRLFEWEKPKGKKK